MVGKRVRRQTRRRGHWYRYECTRWYTWIPP
jgi:hypothetical protein